MDMLYSVWRGHRESIGAAAMMVVADDDVAAMIMVNVRLTRRNGRRLEAGSL